ncbi:ASH domain-containing protein [Phytophthora infestans]|uniref:ASH domain-containing protein n=1 Tax=Phytophthora infestans TaxID=4787 RepID=A0A833WE01_PHYIN|nr:ASH domain-containing protein [Phytophthora infestans]
MFSSQRPRSPVQQRLHDGFRTDRRYLTQMVTEAHNERSTRVDAVLELKKDLDASAAKVGAQSAALQARDQAEKMQQAKMHQSLIDQGRNPYEVARRKVVQRQARRERSRIDRNIQDRQAKLLGQLEAEKVIQRRREKVEDENRAYERKYQREMGRSQEERTNAFLLSRTGKDSLDPTGKSVRVYPSQETTIKDHTFGLGHSAVLTPEHRRRVVEKVSNKGTHNGTKTSSLLLPRRQQNSTETGNNSSRTEDDVDSEKLITSSLAPGRGSRTVNHALLSNSDVKLPPIRNVSKGQDEDNQTDKAAPKPRARSVMEERQLAKARQRQKESRFAQSQVVWGKTFTGNAFLSNPALLWFKDFDVGRAFTLGFTLTNVSNTFNQFRLLPMEEQVVELFDIVYEKPGRMSAGMSCTLKMTFTGTEERDFDTFLSVASPTGVFQLPIRCTCKKSVPILTHRQVRFPEIVAGERTTVTLTLANEGALPLEYRVRRVLPSIEPEPVSSTDVVELNDAETRSVDTFNENPQDDNGQSVDDTDNQEEPGPESLVTSAASTRLSIDTKQLEVIEEVDDPLNPDEQELVDRILDTTRFKPEGADEPIRFTRRGVVAPYSSSAVSFTFAPATAMTLENQPFLFEFPGASSGRLPPIPVLISGVASQVPVFVSRSLVDFRCCAYGKLYRHELTVCNRGKVALKVHIQVPKPLKGYVEFNPSFGFVQAMNSKEGIFPVQVKFRPEDKMWKRIERAGFGSRALGMLAVPVQVSVPDQVVPVFFILKARLTPTELLLKSGNNEKGLHFGTCCVGHSVSHELTVTNPARVPQRIGVTSLPKDVTVADVSEGVGIVLLPGEERILRVVYTPSFPGVLKGAGTMGRLKPVLTLYSSTFNHEYTLTCSGNGVASEVIFSQSTVRLGATSLGQTQTCHVKLTNQSEHHTQLVELKSPPEAASFLKITPLVARLAPQESVRVEIDFEPTEDIFNLVKTRFYEPKMSGGNADSMAYAPSVRVELSTAEELEDVVSVPRSCHLTWTILCFHQLETSSNSAPLKTPVQALEVRTTVLEPFVIPSTTNMDFGQVAIGQTLVRDLVLETSPRVTESVALRAQPLHILGAFRLIGALRELPAGSDNKKKRAIRIEFEPCTPLVYEDELELAALGVNIRVKLKGIGINPNLSLTPEDGNVDFQDRLPIGLLDRDFKGDGRYYGERGAILSSMGLPVFTFSPTSATIPENGTLNVQVVFQPDHQRPDHYSQRFRIKVPNESEQHIITVAGRCWENQLYVFAPTAEGTEPIEKQPLLAPLVEDLFDLPSSISLNQISSNGGNELSAAGLRKPTSSYVLTFNNGDEADTSGIGRTIKTLFIGSTMPSSGVYGGLDEGPTGTLGGSAGTFELVVDTLSPHAKLFTFEPARGSIAAGQQLAVQVTYTPLADFLNSASSAGSKSRPELEVAQWVQLRVECVLKGGSLWRILPTVTGTPAAMGGQQTKGANTSAGSTPEGMDTRIIPVLLRARVET